MSSEFISILREVEFLLSERRELMTSGPVFRILRPQLANEVAQISLLYRGREVSLKLSPTARQVLGYLAQKRMPQTAREIEMALRRVVSRRAAKQYVRRIRLAIQFASRECGLYLDATEILVSEKTESNVCLYRLRARVQYEWE